jgi:hypothetical protein
MLLASGMITLNVSADSCSSNSSCGSNTVTCDDDSVTCPDQNGDICGTKTHFSLRPQHSNEARKMTAVEDKIHRFGAEEFNGVVSLGLQYQQTWKPEKLAKYFFGKQTLTYGPTCDGTFDIFGENLGTTATGTINWNPRIRNFIADFDFWFGLDELVCGLWTRIGVPVNWTQWNLNPCITTEGTGTPAPFAPGQVDFASAGTVASFGSVAQGLAGEGFGLAPKLDCGKICKTHDTAVSGLAFDLGYDFFRRECSHFGASLHFVAPTGTRPSDEFLFAAVSGSQHSWELGATVTASYLAWEGCDGDQRLGLFFDATITHLFEARQRRLFDLKKPDGSTNPMSYWLLLKKFNPTTGAVEGLERAANVLCCDVKVGARVMADLALMVQYDCGCFSGALGWNFWIRSAERVKCNASADCDDKNNKSRSCDIAARTYGIKGSTVVDTAETMSNATVGNCGAVDATTVFLTNADIDKCSALHPRAFSNKVFGWVGYNWRDCEWQPFVAVEGEVEFGHDNKAVDQWGVMLKGGVAF